MDIDQSKLPNHIAIIMDGNRRWAKARMLPAVAGHKQGFETLKEVIKELNSIGVKHLTVYAFSTENWKRSQEEIDGLMNIFRDAIKTFKKEFGKDNYKIDFIGSFERLDNDIREGVVDVTETTKNNTGINIHIALNYGGRDEIIRATRRIFNEIKNSDDITEEMFQKHLDTKATPDPELIIRTSGERRLSNFLSWQSAYSEFYFMDKYWPDFKKEDIKLVLNDFAKRNRRFGGI